MADRYTDYTAAYEYARAQADRLGLDMAIRRVREYGRDGFNVGIARRQDSDDARAEIVGPGMPSCIRGLRKGLGCPVGPSTVAGGG